jgi:hypothetical protein
MKRVGCENLVTPPRRTRERHRRVDHDAEHERHRIPTPLQPACDPDQLFARKSIVLSDSGRDRSMLIDLPHHDYEPEGRGLNPPRQPIHAALMRSVRRSSRGGEADEHCQCLRHAAAQTNSKSRWLRGLIWTCASATADVHGDRAAENSRPIRVATMATSRGGRTWWAHVDFTRINIELTILKKEIEHASL